MKLTLRKSEWLEDWYVIERANHDGRMASSRFSDADVEGCLSEMVEIAAAIESRKHVAFRRCSVRVDGERVYFCSPRNSTRCGECSLYEADELAREIRSVATQTDSAGAEQ